MVNKDDIQKYLDAGIAFTTVTRKRAEELVHELVQSGELQGGDARVRVEEVIERSRKGREVLVAQVRHEVARQLDGMGITNLEDLAKQVASLLGRSAERGRAATAGVKKAAPKKAATKKAAPKKAATKKTAPKKAATKKTAAERASSSGAPGVGSAG